MQCPGRPQSILLALLLGIVPSVALAADENELPPIEYSRSTPDNCVSKLQDLLEGGTAQLKHDDAQGFLPELLKALDVPVESQMLVFSKTSLQRDRISPKTPRAIYFNDEVYVGFCRAGEVIEISAADSRLGAVFYTLDQKKTAQPRLVRQTDNCLVCHSSSRTEGVPGHLVRSLFVDSSGQPMLSEGSHSVDHTTPIEQRWGGWYLTGKHGSQTHLGNFIARGRNVSRPVENAEGQNVETLKGRFPAEHYLTPHSDIVALMVLEHQVMAHNHITKANNAARQAFHYETEMNRALGEPEGTRLESTTRRIQSAGDDLVKALLFVDEAKITAPISGTSGFAEKFSHKGPYDPDGRSLREFDLQRRLFKYPCSYLIYSEAFDQLPGEMRDYVWKRLWQALTQPTDDGPFTHLSQDDRQAIVEILRATKANLPSYWAEGAQ
jgi:hypothetical protein